MFEDLLSAYGSRLVIAIVGVGVGLLLLIGVLWMIRGRNGPSPFVRGGKNRQPRLQVLDAAAVDTRRRLVLVRRDNVEHLIMIGGPTDIVIESGISTATSGTRAASASAASRSEVSESQDIVPFSAMPAAGPRTAPAQRPAPPERRIEPAAESLAAREAPRPASAATAPVPGVVQPASAPAPSRPLPPAPASEPLSASRSDVPVSQTPDVRPEPLRPIAALAAANAAAHSLDNAAEVLDAARGRVFQEEPEPRVVPINPATVPPALQTAAEKPKQLGSDFEKILEQEMANNLAAREAAASGQANRQTLPRDPSVPPVTGATPEPSLQAEVARIFGEMSVTRDK